ncbi:N-acetylneuraminate synthase family protein [Rhizobium paknamense]|uniref:N-acetylneuraminate synthase n=1 Tax=Rhizobium paknamense TaxID=1206817 RepID=A0ABU0IJD6_9HYPH|nr:N-acetylneuraminate synthase family protein [Rhizobium paknamense]MDQ0458365.1 N-acetylneuraminate synthase [Rhizobium paknamense]
MRDLWDAFTDKGRPLLIAEVGLGHDGSLGLAHAFIDAVACTGADAVKFQTHIAEAESSPEEQFRIAFSTQDKTRYDYWHRTSFTQEQWAALKCHADAAGLLFLSSPFSTEAVDLLEAIGICGWKIASGELNSRQMIKRLAATSKPVIASSGMSSMRDVEEIVEMLVNVAPNRHAILQCTTEYPTPPEHVGMNVFDTYRSRFQCPVGLSDHSGTIWPSLIAASRGARILEVHITLSSHMFGPDVSSSLTTEKLAELRIGLDFVHRMLSNPVDKDAAAQEKASLLKLFSKSAMSLRSIEAGEIPNRTSVGFRKPGLGLDEAAFETFAGRALKRTIPAGTFIHAEDFQ